ncbi:unnamed protein product [Caenorhabditis bovis]|uniref:Uncharacterized protein n=1 Tax=Caenorhabditis bovis TaxID=2654633 RepID=A0A8S1EVI6_9PELO|nr:unnamed protein product [Caenorhabditis bovis]
MNTTLCKIFVEIAFYPPFRAVQFLYASLAFITLILIIYFLKVVIQKSTFHPSFKMVLLPCLVLLFYYKDCNFASSVVASIIFATCENGASRLILTSSLFISLVDLILVL